MSSSHDWRLQGFPQFALALGEEVVKDTNVGLVWRHAVLADPPPTGELVEVLARIHCWIHAVQDP